MQIVPQYLPQAFGALLLTLALILTLAPYVFGHDFGVIKVPDLGERTRRTLRWLGPALLILAILLHIPFGKALCDEPQFEEITDPRICGTLREEYVVKPEQPKTCRHPDFGEAGWTRTETISQSSGWRPGGSNPTNWCNELSNAFIQRRSIGPQHQVEVQGVPGESSRKDILGHVTYNYSCTIKVSWEPIYAEKTDVRCGVIPAEKATREVARTCKHQVGTIKVACDKRSPN